MLEKQEVLKAGGITGAVFDAAVKAVLEKAFVEENVYDDSGPVYQEQYREMLAKTVSAENLAEAVPYLGEDGLLSAAVKVYQVMAQEPYRWEFLAIENKVCSSLNCEVQETESTGE